jgi:3-phosphoinositide dependent protein kinase-1
MTVPEHSRIYDILITLYKGEGAFARVVHARRKITQKDAAAATTTERDEEHLAIKIMEKCHIIQNDKVAYVKQEKNLLARLVGSAWIVRLYASFQDADNVYMVMPLAHGGMLQQVIVRRKEDAAAKGLKDMALTHAETSFYLAEIVSALRYLHNKQIVHRDLKVGRIWSLFQLVSCPDEMI